MEKKYESKKADKADFRKSLDEVDSFLVRYHYPFVLDVESTQDIVDVRHKIKLANPLLGLMQLLGALGGGGGVPAEIGGPKESVTQFVLKDLEHSIEKMQEEMVEEDELITKLDFTTDVAAKEFLTQLKAEGGGDGP